LEIVHPAELRDPRYGPSVARSSRMPRFVAAALVAHAAAMGWVVVGNHEPARRAVSPDEARIGAQEIRIDVEAPSTTASPDVVEPGSASPRPRTLARPSAPVEARGSPSIGPVEVLTAPADSTAGTWTFAPAGPASSGARLSSGAFDDAVRGAIRAAVAESSKTHDPLKRALGGYSQHDIELGFVPGGEFVNITRDAVRTSMAPTVGHAVFEFLIDANGTLTSVHVLDASSDRSDWEQVAAEIAKAASGHVTRSPRGGQAVAMTLDVTSAMRTLSGASPTDSTLTKALRAIDDPIDTVIDGTSAPQRVVTAHVVDVQVL
jgi:hypothetical protein